MPLTTASGTMLGSSSPSTGGATATIAASSLTDTLQVVENLGVKNLDYDGMGGFNDNWQATRTYPCLFVPMVPKNEMVEADRITAIGVFKVYLPIDAVVDPQDRLLADGVLYEIRDRIPPLVGQNLLALIAELVE